MPLGYSGMNQDISKDKADNSKYFSALNIRVLATDQQSTFALTNELGNELTFEIPTVTVDSVKSRVSWNNVDVNASSITKFLVYEKTSPTTPGCELEELYTPAGGQATSRDNVIIGTVDTRDGAILATTDDNGWNCVWEMSGIGSGQINLDLLYLSDLSWTTENLIQLLYNYENSIIEKVYFADGENQLRFMNIRQSKENGDLFNLIDVPSSSINTVSEYSLSQPEINTVTGGGSHTAGMIQYAYNLYVLNGSQTTISPLSELQSLDKGVGLGGGEVNESVGRTVIVNVDDIDPDFTHIRLYAIKYTSYNQAPEVSLIADREIDNFDSLSYYDDGSVISTISLTEFLFLGSNPIIPRHIESKDSRLFAINIKEKEFEVDIDTRVYGHTTGGAVKIWQNVELVGGLLSGEELTVSTSTYDVPEKHDAVNRDYDLYNRTSSSSEFGAEGKYFKLIVNQSASLTEEEVVNKQFLKDREIYRFGIVFYNDLGQKSSPKWLCDLKAPEGNLEGNYNTITFEIKSAFTTWLNSTSFEENQKPVGYKIVRADRTLADRTILTQGMINPMVVNYKHDRKEGSPNHRYKNAAAKMPSMVRLFEDSLPQQAVEEGAELSDNGSGNWTYSNTSETITSCSSDDFRAQTWQFTRLMQMFTPELLFESIEVDSSYKLNVIGLKEESDLQGWSAEYNPVSKTNNVEAKFQNGTTPGSPGVTVESILSDPNFLSDKSFFGPTNGENDIMFHQVYREFKGDWNTNNGTRLYEIYGSPEITEKGADFKAYNGDFQFRYSNHLLSLLQDDWRRCSDVNNDAEQQVYGCNSYGAKCITFIEGTDSSSQDPNTRKRLEQIKAATGIAANNGVLVGEFVKDENTAYLGNLYGGNSFEAKSVSTYMEIGQYSDVSVTSLDILSPGDTFVQEFQFQKLSKTETDLGDRRLNQLTEIVSITVETTVDLKNRNDISINAWDNRWQPQYDEFQQYNRVYSQQPSLVENTDPGFKFKKVKEFDTRIISTKEKIPGENIDSWTDFLENETMDLDGKYGPINASLNWKDEIFVWQDTAVARISINPRVQVEGDDSVEVQLGTGGILHDYQYLSTKSGCLNKWAVVASDSAFYYFDLNNKAIMKSNGRGIVGLSDKEGFHNYFINQAKYEELIGDNSVSLNGISTGYNPVNNDIYFSFKQLTFNDTNNRFSGPDYSNDFTICFNEGLDAFTSFYSYVPSWYITRGSKMFTTQPNSRGLWEHFKGEKGVFYGVTHASNIIFNVSPRQGDGEYTFNNLRYRMEMKDVDGNDLLNETFNYVRLYNEYQDTNQVDIELRRNAKRRNRVWNITLPREENSRNRIKSPWCFLELRLSNANDYRMVAHDLIVSYTEY